MKKILIVGGGAREHAIAETFARSPQEPEIFAFAKHRNPGISQLVASYECGSLSEFSALRDFAKRTRPDFAFIGPDNPIADGAADALMELGIPSVAPFQKQAQIESSKSFARELLEKHEIYGNPRFRVFHQLEGIRRYMEELRQFVVKADGLEGGKGVKVFGEHLHRIEDALDFAGLCLDRTGRVVIEEKLEGEEFSLMFFADGKTLIPMPVIQDHKRAYENDSGPNTGGMGTWTDVNHSLPFLDPEDLEQAQEMSEKVLHAIQFETGGPYRGILYGGFMAVKDGIRLIEYNARFGDPEAMNVLNILETDFLEICEAILESRLGEISVRFKHLATVLKYLVPDGYPDEVKPGLSISIPSIPNDAKLYYGSLEEENGEFKLLGSRALAVLGTGESVSEAEEAAQRGIEGISGPVFYRRDIGSEALIQKRIDHMKLLRGI